MPHLLSTATADAVGQIPLWMAGPFALLLLLIAVMPLSPERLKHFWEKRYPWVALGLGLLVAAHYFFRVPHGGARVLETAHEYFSFIVLIGSLFTVAGGLHLSIRGEARPLANVIFLFVGAVLANVIGTTGASMVLIRPWIRMNKYRVTAYHIVFFIFVVSNVGGALTPIGDPPLFLGFLHGVPFFWLVEKAVGAWALCLALILIVFYWIDRRNFLRAPGAIRQKETAQGPLVRVEGMHNVFFLGLIMTAVFLPERYMIREIAMLGAAIAAYWTTKPQVRQSNAFTFSPIKEVGFLFAGIFMTMMPALDYLGQNGKEFGLDRPLPYYLASGSLSSVLDNAPTYLNFLTLAEASVSPAEVQARADAAAAQTPVAEKARAREAVILQWMMDTANRTDAGVPSYLFIVAVSLSSVFFGAMTYIGNGPNFMVKSIAEASSVRTPSFFGYILRYSLPVLLPILLLVGWIFLG